MRAIAYIALAALVVMATGATEAETRAATFLKSIEGFRPTAYTDAAGNLTIGYGFTSADMVGKGYLSEVEASAALYDICHDISTRLRAELGGQRLTVAEEAALISFIYNVGWYNFKTSTMCRLLKEGKRGKVVADEFLRWVYVTKGGRKVVCDGLKIRRARERMQFMVG